MSLTTLAENIARRVKHYQRRLRQGLVRQMVRGFGGPMARFVREMAETGEGTEACLKEGVLPMMVHFYSPVPDIEELNERKIWNRRSSMAGIDFRPEAQLALLKRLGATYGDECYWPIDATADPKQFFTHNGSFSYGCAAALHTTIRDAKPKRVIEIGSGNSSLLISKALSFNIRDDPTQKPEYTIVDPYPRDIIRNGLPLLYKVVTQRVELLQPEFFDQLEQNDILFIDSSHVSKIGSDVNFLVLDVVPRVKPGVIIHFHDIPMPFEYPETYAKNPCFRVFWNESYLLQAFLACNQEFEILLAMCYLQTDHMNEFCSAFRKFKLDENWANSGSLWIRHKVKA